MDFVNFNEWWWSGYWSKYVHILRKMHLTFGLDVTFVDSIGDSLRKLSPKKPMYKCMTLTIGFFPVHFVGWSYSFPTRTEQILWRAACVTMMATLLALMIFAELVGTYPTLRQAVRQYSLFKVVPMDHLVSDYQLEKTHQIADIVLYVRD